MSAHCTDATCRVLGKRRRVAALQIRISPRFVRIIRPFLVSTGRRLWARESGGEPPAVQTFLGEHARPGRRETRPRVSHFARGADMNPCNFSARPGFPRGRGKLRPGRARSLSNSTTPRERWTGADGRNRVVPSAMDAPPLLKQNGASVFEQAYAGNEVKKKIRANPQKG